MPYAIRVPDLRGGYVDVVETVLRDGRTTSPRGQVTTELLDVIIEVEDPYDVLPVGVGRKLNLGIAAYEAAQLVAGVSEPDVITKIAPQFERYMDNGAFWGAYGRRVGDQLEAVVRKLSEDPDSRQAVVTLWNPDMDNTPGKSDYPCTVMFQFLIRDGELIMHTTMRSNDVWLGLAYDAFMFTQCQITIAGALGVPVGSYHHHAVSLHLYERDVPKVDRLVRPTPTSMRPMPRLVGFSAPIAGDPVRKMRYARREAAATITLALSGADEARMDERYAGAVSVDWYIRAMREAIARGET